MRELVSQQSCRGGVALVVTGAERDFITGGNSISIVCSRELRCLVASVDSNSVRVDSHEGLEESP